LESGLPDLCKTPASYGGDEAVRQLIKKQKVPVGSASWVIRNFAGALHGLASKIQPRQISWSQKTHVHHVIEDFLIVLPVPGTSPNGRPGKWDAQLVSEVRKVAHQARESELSGKRSFWERVAKETLNTAFQQVPNTSLFTNWL
jgi:hypothetical protein